MERIVTYASNRLDGLERVAKSAPSVFVTTPLDEDAAWGLAYRQGDEVLTKKRPLRAGAALDLDELLRDAQTDRAFLHLGQPMPRGFSRDEVGPHRFEHLAFSCIGASSMGVTGDGDVLEAYGFLAQGTPAQRLFAHLLTLLDRGGGSAETTPAQVRAAFRELHARAGSESFGAVFGNSRRSYVYARGMDLAFQHRDEPVGSPHAAEPPFRAVVLALGDLTGLPEDFRRAPSRDVFGVVEFDGALELGEA
ncbi:MAG: hypothetical protein GXY23_06810 [Myxococcales bacterium]|nr:hypothetical protein [Myxococcales bacterium]